MTAIVQGERLTKSARFIHHINNMGWNKNTIRIWLSENNIYIKETPQPEAIRVCIGGDGFGWYAPIDLVRSMLVV